MNIFQESEGVWSMRRFCSFILYIMGIILAGACIINNISDWKLVLVLVGLPLGIATLLLLFTTWSDIKGVVDAVKD